MTGKTLSELAWNAYTDTNLEPLAKALTEFGASPKLARKLASYKGACWLGAAQRLKSDHELLEELNNTCSVLPPSRWPKLG